MTELAIDIVSSIWLSPWLNTPMTYGLGMILKGPLRRSVVGLLVSFSQTKSSLLLVDYLESILLLKGGTQPLPFLLNKYPKDQQQGTEENPNQEPSNIPRYMVRR
jgi:hypothetical protein